jgi:hypothetical protein
MTEADWLTDTNPAYLSRKVRSCPWRWQCLYICACWSTVRDLLASENSRVELELLEDFAEAKPPYDCFGSFESMFLSIVEFELERARRAPFTLDGDRLRLEAADIAAAAAGDYDDGEAEESWNFITCELEDAGERLRVARDELGRGLCALARCVFGNPFRPTPVIDPAVLA